MPIMLQQGFELLANKLLLLLRASLDLGYIPMSWRHIRVVSIPKLGKPMSQAKSLWTISLTSVVLKTLEKLLDRHIRGGVLVEKAHQNQFAYRAGMSTETVLFQVIYRLNQRRLHWVPSWILRGPFNNTSFMQLLRLQESGELRRPVVSGSVPCSKAD
jgi:hypothetical protein